MFKYNVNTLKEIEKIFKEGGYKVRYERGNFKPGYCILEDKRIVVINKYYSLESKINCLIEILGQVELQTVNLSTDSQQLLESLMSNYSKH